MFEEAKWIGVPASEIRRGRILQGEMNNRFAYFCLDIELTETGTLWLQISAVARYRLWINGRPVLSGPCKGDRYRQYYDEVEATEYLAVGSNRLAVQVLACDSYIVNNRMKNGQQPLMAYAGLPLGHRLAVEGAVCGQEGRKLAEVTTGIAPWKVRLEDSYQLEYQEPYLTWFGAIAERIPHTAMDFGWKRSGGGSGFAEADILENVRVEDGNKGCGNIGALVMQEREIPLLYEREGYFARELSDAGPRSAVTGWHVGNGESKEILLDAGEIKTAFMCWTFSGGARRKIRFTYAERFTNPDKEIDRDSYAEGSLDGMQDEIILDGSALSYEPFWYRTFRFVKLEITAGEGELAIAPPVFRETGYPLEIVSRVESSEKWVGDIWRLCVNTLCRCMNETYMDCPYYEQMQFPMDTRLQALYTYLVSGDTRLARKALRDFHCSMTPDGLIQGKYPCSHTQIISTFSLHYIFMLWEYYMQTGDRKIVARYRPDVDLILDYYDRKIKDGLVENLGYWEFVDWREEWEYGAPAAVAKGPSTVINLMYAYALRCAANICRETGRAGVAEEYDARRREICRQVRERCYSERMQMFREGPSFEQYSIHAQAWAVLNGIVEKEQAGAMMERALTDRGVIQNSFSTSFEVFRALKISGRYDLAERILELWKQLPRKGCTTCPEVPENSRSECHAWSA